MIAAITPTRGDRPEFMEHCRWLVEQQTSNVRHFPVDYVPRNGECDLGGRVQRGLSLAFLAGAEFVLVMEDDDWYSPDYAAFMYQEWCERGKPAMIGLRPTVYYHLGSRRYRVLQHPGRASLCCMGFGPQILDHMTWPDGERFLDLWLWKRVPGEAFLVPAVGYGSHGGKHYHIGIKHGIGMCGGSGHSDRFNYPHDDRDFSLLASWVDVRSLAFYLRVSGELQKRD